jgi:hypothetical protein
MKDILIFFLTANDRHFYFDKFLKEINNCKNSDRLHLLILNSSNDMTYYNAALAYSSITFECVYVPCPKWDYLPKVRYSIDYATKHNFKYILNYL